MRQFKGQEPEQEAIKRIWKDVCDLGLFTAKAFANVSNVDGHSIGSILVHFLALIANSELSLYTNGSATFSSEKGFKSYLTGDLDV